MKQTQPLEVGLPVIDLDKMLAFYTDVLSCTETRRADIPAELSAPLTAAAEGYINVWLQTPGGEIIKMMRPPAAPDQTPQADWLAGRTGLAYLTFYCSDLTETLAKAEAAGATLRSERALIAEGADLRLCFFADPEGNVIELVEVKAG